MSGRDLFKGIGRRCQNLAERFLEGVSRFVVSLTWAILLGVFLFIVYLVIRHAPR